MLSHFNKFSNKFGLRNETENDIIQERQNSLNQMKERTLGFSKEILGAFQVHVDESKEIQVLQVYHKTHVSTCLSSLYCLSLAGLQSRNPSTCLMHNLELI